MAPERHRGNTVAVPEYGRSCKPVASLLQACCRLVAGLLEASSFSLPPGPQAEHRSGPACERRSVPQGQGIGYRLRKGCQGYRDLTDFKLACASHSGLTRSRDGGADEMLRYAEFRIRARLATSCEMGKTPKVEQQDSTGR